MNEFNGDQVSPTRRFDLNDAPLAPVMRFWDWLVVLIISLLPIANVIVMIIWAADSKANPNRTNYAKAMLVLIAAYILITAVFFGYFTGMIVKMATMFQ